MEYEVIAVRDNGDEYWIDQFPTPDEADRAAEDHARFTGFEYRVRPVSERDAEEE